MSNYDKFPRIDVPGGDRGVTRGWAGIAARLQSALLALPGASALVVIECYPGVSIEEIREALQPVLAPVLWIDSKEAMLSASEVDRLVAPDLGGDDPVFGYMSRLILEQFFDAGKTAAIRRRIAAAPGPVVVIGTGALVVAPEPGVLVYADLPRWEAQQRQRRGEISNLGTENRGLKPSLLYKRSLFIDWRVCDRMKRRSMDSWTHVLDTCIPDDPKLVDGAIYTQALAHCVTRPFRVVPFFDPGPWGGQWMKEVCDLDRSKANFAWCFDCVPEENSLLLGFGDTVVEIPSINLVFARPRELLGEPAHGRFGAEFPIRFDFLDTMGGGNLSLQVHPLTEYIQDRFGMRYTQDESYYLLDADPGAVVYLGRKRDADFAEMIDALEAAQRGERPFDDERFIARFPARKHDHFLIPAGTLHGSGSHSMVLEISATPFIFTFKLWDWDRLGLDGKPRPINIARGKENIRWERDEDYAAERLVNRISAVGHGEGWREERTGLHEAEFIETRRHWFTKSVPHETGGTRAGSVNVLNLIEGEEAVVESPTGAFEPFVVHFAETFIVPAAVGAYRIRPVGRGADTECATIKAFVRCQP